MSLRYKLLILILTLTGLSLVIFLALSVRLFKQDKIAYIFDLSAANSKGFATQVRTELRMHSSEMSLFVSEFDFSKKTFGQSVQNLFNKNENLIEVSLNKWNGKNYENIAVMKKSDLDEDKRRSFDLIIDQVQNQAYQDTISFRLFSSDTEYLVFSQKVLMDGDPTTYFISSVDHEEGLSTLIKKSPIYDIFIARSDGQVLLQSKIETPIQTLKTWDFFKKISSDSIPDGVEETFGPTGQPDIVSYSKLGVSNLISISTVGRSLALQVIDTLLLRAGLFFLAIISLSVILAIYFSKKITNQLSTLDSATTEIAAGNFNVVLEINSSDEIGNLSKNFNTMVEKISDLMKDNVVKARMEKELETAKIVQDTLFPENNSKIDRVSISGYYEPASECSGDWWYYFKSRNKVFACIGDATGHGAPAALITSAARSAVSLIEASPSLTPSSFLLLLNRAIYASSKGKIQMTFFVTCIDPDNNKLTYANASHTTPYLIKKSNEPITKNSLIPLMSEIQGARLGQDITSRYTETSIDFAAGDMVFIYTDGLTDIENQKAKTWDERGLMKALTLAKNEGLDLKGVVDIIVEKSAEFRNQAPLSDDVTFFAFEFS